MITLYKEEDKKLISYADQMNIIERFENNMWMNMVDPTQEELVKVSAKTGIELDLLLPALDEEESARCEFDESGTLLILDTPCIEIGANGKENYSTIPFFIVYNSSYFITLCSEKTTLIDTTLQIIKKIEPHKHIRLALQLLYRLSSSYITCLKKIDAQTKRMERVLHASQKNKELFELMELNKTLVYFSTSLSANKNVLVKLSRLPEYKKYEDDFELMEDVLIENNQALEMCSIFRQILSAMAETFASVISNNLNVVMKALAIITIVLSIPTIIASFFGMNFQSIPLYNNPIGFYYAIIISVVLAAVGGAMLYFYSKKTKR